MINEEKDSTPDKPTKKQIIEALNLISNASKSSLEFLEAVSKKYEKWDDFIDAITAWLGLEGEDKKFFIDIIHQSIKLEISTKIRWKLVNTKLGTDQTKYIVGEAIKAKKLNITTNTQSATLGLIQEIREYHPDWKAKKEREERKNGSLTAQTPADKPTKDDAVLGDGVLDAEMRKVEKESAQVAAKKQQARQEKEKRRNKLVKLQNEANQTTDVSRLKKISGELYQFSREFPMQADGIRREIKAKITRIQNKIDQEKPQNQIGTSEYQEVIGYILLGLTQGNLDIEAAKDKIEKYANTFASTSTTCRIPSARITPTACKTQVMLAVYEGLQKKAGEYPIIRGKETYAIQQLISLGISEQSATRAVIENLCFLQRYQEAQALIDAYEAEHEGEEITTQVVRNFSGLVSRYKGSKTTGPLIINQGTKKEVR